MPRSPSPSQSPSQNPTPNPNPHRLPSPHPALLLTATLLAAPLAQALPVGTVATIYNDRAPADVRYLCTEPATCSVTGVKEVWHGRHAQWHYKLVTGVFACTNDFFGDPLSGVRKDCYVRDLMEPTMLPPRLAVLPVRIDLNDLLAVDGGRYRFDVVVGSGRFAVTASPWIGNLTALGLPTEPGMNQDYFQFNLLDSRMPVRQYSLFVAATLERCVHAQRRPDGGTRLSQGRIMELYTLTSQPSARTIPQRSQSQRLCTNDKGELSFHLKPPSIDAFQIKVVNHSVDGSASDVFDYFIPTALNPVLAP